MSHRREKYAGITTAQIKACTERLKPNHVSVLLASMEGGYPDIAQSLGLNIGTVKSRLHRARAALAAELVKRAAEAAR